MIFYEWTQKKNLRYVYPLTLFRIFYLNYKISFLITVRITFKMLNIVMYAIHVMWCKLIVSMNQTVQYIKSECTIYTLTRWQCCVVFGRLLTRAKATSFRAEYRRSGCSAMFSRNVRFQVDITPTHGGSFDCVPYCLTFTLISGNLPSTNFYCEPISWFTCEKLAQS